MPIGNNKIMVRLREALRRGVRLLDLESNRDVEYGFARRHVTGEGASVLDVGGCGSLLNLYLARKGFRVTVFDARPYHEQHPNIESVTGDFLENELPESSFDFVTLISTIEHIGFGSYGAPTHEDGDFDAMEQVKRVLKPEGKIIVTFPFTGEHKVIPGFERWYDRERAARLFDGLHVHVSEYYVPDTTFLGRRFFSPSTPEHIAQTERLYNCQGCACFVLSPQPPDGL
mgnify:CR=1 FL=1